MPNSSASGQQSKQVGPGRKEMHLARTKATSTLHRTYPVDNWNITPSEGTWMQVFPGEPEGWPSRRQRQRWRSVCGSFTGSISRQEGKRSRQGKEWDREAVTMDTRGNPTGSPETGTVFQTCPKSRQGTRPLEPLGIYHWVRMPTRRGWTSWNQAASFSRRHSSAESSQQPRHLSIGQRHLHRPTWRAGRHSTQNKVKVAQSCPTLCNPVDCTVHGIL